MYKLCPENGVLAHMEVLPLPGEATPIQQQVDTGGSKCIDLMESILMCLNVYDCLFSVMTEEF